MHNNENKIVQGLWVGDLQPICDVTMISHMKAGHEFHLYIYDGMTNVEDIPEGVVVKDANEIYPYKFRETHFHHPYASLSDVFRYYLLYEKGGIWVDMDIYCNKFYDFKEDYVFAYETDEGGIGSGFIKAPKGSKFMETLKTKALVVFEGTEVIRDAEIGPRLLEKVIKEFNFEKYIKPRYTIYPFSPGQFNEMWLPKSRIPENSYGVHLWGELFRHFDIEWQPWAEGVISEIQQKSLGYSGSSVLNFKNFKQEFRKRIRRHYDISKEMSSYPKVKFSDYIMNCYINYSQRNLDFDSLLS